MTKWNLPELNLLATKVGQFIQYWGFKKVHGQIWTYIYLAQEPVDATTLVRELGVSKALVSLAVKDLMSYDVIRVAGKGGRRKILLEANPDPFAVITNILSTREAVLVKEAREACQSLRVLAPTDRTVVNEDRLRDIEEMIQLAETSLAAVISTRLNAILDCLSETESKRADVIS